MRRGIEKSQDYVPQPVTMELTASGYEVGKRTGDAASIGVAQSTRSNVRNAPLLRVTVRSRLDTLTDHLLLWALLLVLLACPFEVGYPPIGRILFATFTDLELLLFAVAGAMFLRLVVSTEARRRLLRLPLAAPIVALVLACIASTIFGEYRSLGTQTVYRLLMGAVVFASVAEALRGRRRVITALVVFVSGALLSASLGLLEFVPWLNIEPWLKAFKPQPTTVGGLLRLSGSFEYANGAAVFFEMALPVLLGIVLASVSAHSISRLPGAGQADTGATTTGTRRLARLISGTVLFVAVALLTIALILTFSRASWIGVLVTFAVIGATTYFTTRHSETLQRVWRSVRGPLLALLGVVSLAAGYICIAQPLLRLRLTGENDSAWYRYGLRQSGSLSQIAAGALISVPVTLSNPGPMEWNAARVPVVDLSYHWKVDGSAYYEVFDGLRTPLPHDVAPGESVTVSAFVQAPPTPGKYTLEWDLVQENVSWFSEKSKDLTVSAVVSVDTPSARTATATSADLAGLRSGVAVQSVDDADTSTVSRLQLWRTALSMFLAHPLTGVGPDGFRNLYGKYAGKSTWNANIYTNNTYIEMFTNLGLIGGLSFVWLIGLGLFRTVQNARLPRTSKARDDKMVAAWLLCLGPSAAVVSFAVHGFTDYFLFSTPLYTAFWFVLGVSVLWPRLIQNEATRTLNTGHDVRETGSSVVPQGGL